MLVNIHHDSPREHARLLVSGVIFLAGIALLLGLAIAIYNKEFDRVTTVTVKADRAGLQLAKFGDVRMNGVLVGQVRAIEQDGEEASITIALEPDAAEEVPENVTVEILPTTLFGQKYLSLVKPRNASGRIENGAVIPSSRVETNVELSRILADLFPLLRSVRPADLNYTLNALATALEGRGDQLGEQGVTLNAYLDDIEGSLPQLRTDLIKLADVAQTYEDAAPDLLDVLDNLTVTGKTIIERRRDLDIFFGDLRDLADTTTRVLGDNEADLIRIGEVTEPVLNLLAAYSPEFPCLIRGSARYAPVLARTFEGNQVKQYLEFGTVQTPVYTREDLPRYGETGHGPWCSGLPFPPVPIGPEKFDDGANLNESTNGFLPEGGPTSRPAPGFAQLAGVTSGYAGTEGDQAVLNAMLAGQTGRAADDYGSLGSLLYGPVVREGATP